MLRPEYMVVDFATGTAWIEDPEHDTFPDVRNMAAFERICRFVDGDHVHAFRNVDDAGRYVEEQFPQEKTDG